MLKETTINDKNNNKIISKLHQVHFKVNIAEKCENIHFFFNSTRLVMQLTSAWAPMAKFQYIIGL